MLLQSNPVDQSQLLLQPEGMVHFGIALQLFQNLSRDGMPLSSIGVKCPLSLLLIIIICTSIYSTIHEEASAMHACVCNRVTDSQIS